MPSGLRDGGSGSQTQLWPCPLVDNSYWVNSFFTPIPHSYTSLPLDGVARNVFLLFIDMDTQNYAIYSVWIHYFPFLLFPRREKTIWPELESNQGPVDSQATAPTI